MDKNYHSFDDQPCLETNTCLGAKLLRLAPINNRQEALLARLEENVTSVPAGTLLLNEGEPVRDLIILNEGWVSCRKQLPDGRMSISQILHPGDIVGFENLAFKQVKNNCLAESNLKVCRFPREHLNNVFNESPRISALMMALGAIEQAIISDRVMISRRNDGEARLALFLLQTLARLRLMNDQIYDQFHCPLRQQQIGDATGLTSVHVSRTLGRLEDRGLLARRGQFIRILDEKKLAELVDFNDRYQQLDFSWLPED
ncbi:Crp/Fnr family transcriptional regulator [Ponticaulis profundi]|uniref:Crp/Fnr family transcriptional regulator n=1 Tax=Ponticaulis profundi TaxID=2665222 RepID=A0ABW1SBC4_9PROT